MIVKLIALSLLVALLLPMLGGIRRIRDLPKSSKTPEQDAITDAEPAEQTDNRPD
jgi:hypothetical protein